MQVPCRKTHQGHSGFRLCFPDLTLSIKFCILIKNLEISHKLTNQLLIEICNFVHSTLWLRKASNIWTENWDIKVKQIWKNLCNSALLCTGHKKRERATAPARGSRSERLLKAPRPSPHGAPASPGSRFCFCLYKQLQHRTLNLNLCKETLPLWHSV